MGFEGGELVLTAKPQKRSQNTGNCNYISHILMGGIVSNHIKRCPKIVDNVPLLKKKV